jgi:hypothetical protein
MAKVWRDRSTKGLRNASSTISLWEKRDKLRQQGENLLDAIAATKGSTLLYERLSSIEAQIRNIGELLPAHRKRAAVPSVSDLQGFLERKLEGLECVIANNPEVAKQLILKRVGKLMMDPMYPSDGPTYEVRGDIGLFASSDHRDGQSWVKSRSGRISAKASAAA